MVNGEIYAAFPFRLVVWRFTLNRMAPAEMYFAYQDYQGTILAIADDNGGIVEEYSYDAWGNRRDESTLENNYYPTGGNGVWQGFFHRGYTSHEHMECFGLINMNGRLYDPLLGRMLSPDKYVQAPDFSQNFNRYSYAWNNPLTYSDPSGDIILTSLSRSIGFIDGFFSTSSGRLSAGWNEANLRAGNTLKITGGLFASDPNKSTGGRIWEVTSRFTWQLPQTIGGLATAHSYNTLGLGGGVESVDYAFGATVVKTRNEWEKGSGIAQGSFIVGDNQIEADPNNWLFQHEYGHYLQSQSMGWAYYSRVGIPSILSSSPQSLNPVELDANRRAFLYFNEHVDGFYKSRDERFEKRGWNFSKNPLNLNRDYIDFNDYNEMLTLNKVSSKWYDYFWQGALGFPLGTIGVGLYNTYRYNNR